MPVAAPPEVRAEAIRLYLEGETCGTVAARLGVSPTAVSKWVVAKHGRGARPASTCTVDGCDSPHRARGYCTTHYGQAIEGKTPRAEVWLEDVEWLAETGESWSGAQRRLGVGEDALRRRLERADRYDLVTVLKRREVSV